MGYFELDNGKITARIASFGAELQSLKDAGSGREYMWSAIRHTGRECLRCFFHW